MGKAQLTDFIFRIFATGFLTMLFSVFVGVLATISENMNFFAWSQRICWIGGIVMFISALLMTWLL